MRWPSLSVSTSTPSQSKRRADGRTEDEDKAAQLTVVEAFLLTGFVFSAADQLMVTAVPKREDDDDKNFRGRVQEQLIAGAFE
ncbi:hypothetical protein Nepgr_023365 [Nepenthes gracilis]|uniref:Uncharacterized protein n=1 Tax=Nepenthes gracilis TaxID=150966 RepID=A0AAD3XXT8_NEPGR|nr:hypothetical protein Nepgr_023365 [Nepenthes gracilis]